MFFTTCLKAEKCLVSLDMTFDIRMSGKIWEGCEVWDSMIIIFFNLLLEVWILLMVSLFLIKILTGAYVFWHITPCHWMSVTHTVYLHGCSPLTLDPEEEDILNLWNIRKYPVVQCHILEDFNLEQQSCENARSHIKLVILFIVVPALNFQIICLACILCEFEATALDHLN